MNTQPNSSKDRFTIQDMLAEARIGLKRLKPTEALHAQKNNALFLDTRVSEDREREGVIPGSIHVPLSVIQWRVDPSSGFQNPNIRDFEQTLIVVCNEGYSSSLAAASLQRLGFVNATDLDGGFRGWKAAGLPVCHASENIEASASSVHAVKRFRLREHLYRIFLKVFQ
jgi:rhodanese-related sulfurtransferase